MEHGTGRGPDSPLGDSSWSADRQEGRPLVRNQTLCGHGNRWEVIENNRGSSKVSVKKKDCLVKPCLSFWNFF